MSEIDWTHHTVDSLRELARRYRDEANRLHFQLSTCAYLDRIEQTPQAFRIYGTIDSILSAGYDADHIVSILVSGYTGLEQDTYLAEIAAWRRRAEQAEAALGLARAELDRLRAERDGGTAVG